MQKRGAFAFHANIYFFPELLYISKQNRRIDLRPLSGFGRRTFNASYLMDVRNNIRDGTIQFNTAERTLTHTTFIFEN